MPVAVSEPVAELEIDLPERLAVGRGNAFVIGGYCYLPGARTHALWLALDGERQRVERFRLPRQDVFERLGGEGRDEAFRSGFVAMATVAPREAAERVRAQLVLGLGGGAEASADLGEILLEPAAAAPEAPSPAYPGGPGPRVAICMATYDPPPELLRVQLDSLRAQTHRNWVCVISDDASSPQSRELLAAEVEGDPRFVLSPGARRLGFYGNFERALAMTPADAEYVTLCDQDDRWHPAKLERLLERMKPGVELAYSDARIVDPGGRVVHDSYWTSRRTNHTNLGSLLVANTVTGAASLFRRELLEDALPFPPQLASPFHDHWLALVALARGRIDYIEEPLYDYVQHGGAVIGHAGANVIDPPERPGLLERLRRPGDGSRIVYFYNWSQQELFAEVLRARCWERMSARKRRALRRFASCDSSLIGLGWLLARRARRLWGRNETLDVERYYAKALLRRRAVSLWTLGRRRPGRWLPRDASIPPAPREDAS